MKPVLVMAGFDPGLDKATSDLTAPDRLRAPVAVDLNVELPTAPPGRPRNQPTRAAGAPAGASGTRVLVGPEVVEALDPSLARVQRDLAMGAPYVDVAVGTGWLRYFASGAVMPVQRTRVVDTNKYTSAAAAAGIAPQGRKEAERRRRQLAR